MSISYDTISNIFHFALKYEHDKKQPYSSVNEGLYTLASSARELHS